MTWCERHIFATDSVHGWVIVMVPHGRLTESQIASLDITAFQIGACCSQMHLWHGSMLTNVVYALSWAL